MKEGEEADDPPAHGGREDLKICLENTYGSIPYTDVRVRRKGQCSC